MTGKASEPAAGFQITIQGHPKDQAPDASNRLRPAVPTAMIGGGTWEGAHARHEAAGVRHTARGCGGGVAVEARAQQSSSILIGFLSASSAAAFTKEIDAFRDGLRKLGYIEGRNVRLEYRFASGDLDELAVLGAELVQLKPNIIVSFALPATLALAKATSTIPIVMASGADPVGFGLVKSLSHPGGNITGLTNFAEELAFQADRCHA